MIQKNENRIRRAAFGLALLSMAFAPLPAGPAQEKPKTDPKPEVLKVFAEIVGEFLFSAGGQEAVVAFSVTDGRLWAEDRSVEPYATVEVLPVDPAKLRFEATGVQGNLLALEFSRDENGKITRALIKTLGTEVPGKRIK